MRSLGSNRRKRIAALLLTLALAVCTACLGASVEDGGLVLYALNVGKADCLLLNSGELWYMIDTGRAETWGLVRGMLDDLGVTRLDGLIITHTDDDHAEAAAALAQSDIEVGAWYASSFFNVKEKKHPAILAAVSRGQTAGLLSAGDRLPFGSGTLSVLGPVRQDAETENNNSLVLLAETADGTILLTGDMQLDEEYDLLRSGAFRQTDVLKVPDHAEDHAVSSSLIQTVRPKAAVISTNSVDEPDTPSPRVLQLLRNAGAQTVITQSAEAAVRVVLRSGTPEVSLLSCGDRPEKRKDVTITDRSTAQDVVSVRNSGTAAADLSGWYIFSEKGNEIFVFPEGALLAPGASFTVSSLSSPDAGDYVWPEEKVWNRKNSDPAKLYDRFGRLIDVYD